MGSDPVFSLVDGAACSVTCSVYLDPQVTSRYLLVTVVTSYVLLLVLLQGRARHSIRRRPPSRSHRMSSSGDEVGVAEGVDSCLPSPVEGGRGGGGGEKGGVVAKEEEGEIEGGGGGEEVGGGEVFKQEGEREQTEQMDRSTCAETHKSHEEEDHPQTSTTPTEEEEAEEKPTAKQEAAAEGDREEEMEVIRVLHHFLFLWLSLQTWR